MKFPVRLLPLAIIAVSSCHCYSNDVRTALRIAGTNRCELEKVLTHYRDSGLKYDAAIYLVENMPFHLSYDWGQYREYCNDLDSLFLSGLEEETLVAAVDSVTKNTRIPLLEDLKTITSDYLISQIDKAFRQWETSPYLQHLNFDEFCEWCLPYKCLEYQPIYDWRAEFRLDADACPDFAKLAQIDEDLFNSRIAASVANEAICKLFRESKAKIKDLNVLSLFTRDCLFDFPYENCIYRGTTGLLNCQANGIPVSMDFTPHWADRHSQHYWNCVFATTRNNINYEPFKGRPGGYHNNDKVLAKVYRFSYSMHPVLKQAVLHGENIPNSLRQMFFKDVTDEYGPVTQIDMKVKHRIARYAYLAVFDDYDWTPVDICRLNGRRASFKNVGKGILYNIVAYVDGEVVPIAEPFYLSARGEYKTFPADMELRQSIRTCRKYPAFRHIFQIDHYIQSCDIEAGNSTDDFTLVETIPEMNLLAGELNVEIDSAFRYWKLVVPKKKNAHIAEVFFYDANDSILTVSAVYPDSTDTRMLFDGDPLTYCKIESFENGVILDFGQSVNVKDIAYYKRGDGNDIFPGDEYDLYYWGESGWNIIGRKTARHPYLDWEDVPSNGLYYIKGLKRGRQNRIFSYEQGKMHWM